MRIMTSYLIDGRGQAADGRRSKAAPVVVLDDLGGDDEVTADSPAEASDDTLDVDWTEDGESDVHGDEGSSIDAAPRVKAERSLRQAVDPYAAYMASLKDVERLDRELEHELAVEYARTHDPKLARRLVTANLKLVVKLAHEYSRANKNLLDLIQEGNVGLVQAIDKYDANRGVKLSSYAAWWIRAYMLRWLLQNARIVRLGTTATQRKLFFNLRKEKAKLERHGFVASTENVAKAMRLPEGEVREMEQRMGSPDASLDAPIDREGEGRSRLDVIESAMPRPDDATEALEFRARLRDALVTFGGRLKGRDRRLFDERLMNDAPRTLQELGDEFGISRERTRQLEMRLMARLKSYLSAALGDAVGIAHALAH